MDSLPVNILDLIILAVLAISGLIGLARGFVKEVLSLAAWIGAAWVTLTFYDQAKAYVETQLTDPLVISVVAGGGLFIAALVVLMIIAKVLSSGIQKVSLLGPIDRVLGLGFGLLRGALVLGLAYLLTMQLVDDSQHEPDWIADSKLLEHVATAASVLEALIPQRVGEAQELLERSQDTLEGTGYTPDINRQIPDLIERQPPE
ncbi:MAG: CvpA family protein [Alphaproteobacteria bacterium]